MPTLILQSGLEVQHFAGDPGQPVLVHLRRPGKTQASEYWVDLLRSDWGTGLRFRKIWDGPRKSVHDDIYDVNINGDTATCECMGHMAHGTPCKHIEAARLLLDEGIIKPAPRPEHAPERPGRAVRNDAPPNVAPLATLGELHSMRIGETRDVNGKPVERVAAGWLIGGRFAASYRQIADLLLAS